MKKQIIMNLFSTYVGRAVGMVLGFFLVPFLIGKLGIDTFGVIVLVESLSRFIELVSSSIRMALARHATFALAQDKMEEFTDYLSTGRVILFAAAAIVFVLGVGFSFLVPHIFKIPAEHIEDSRNLFLLFITAFTITFPNMVFWSSLYAKQRYDLLNVASTSALILRAVLVLIVFSILPERFVNLTTYGIIFLAVVWADNFMVYCWSRRIFPNVRIQLKRFSADKVKQIFLFGAFTSIIYSSGVLYENLIQILINVLWGPRFNAIYGIADKFPSALKRLFAEPAWTLTPTFTDLVARGEKDKLKSLYFMYSKAILISSLPFVLFFMVMADAVIMVWVGPDFAMAATMMSISTIPLLISMPNAVSSCIYNAYGKVRVPSLVSVCSVVSMLILGVTLSRGFSMGLVGISVAETSVLLVTSGLYSAYYACRISGLSLREFRRHVYLPPFLWGCLTTGTALFAYRSIFGGFLKLDAISVLILVLWTLAYFIGMYRLTLNPVEKGYLQGMLRSVANKLGLTRA